MGGVFANPLSHAFPSIGNPATKTNVATARKIPLLMLVPSPGVSRLASR